MFRYSGPVRVRWDLFVILLALYNCIIIPIDIAFPLADFGPIGYEIADRIIDVMFLLDIIVSFRTTFYNKHGEEVFDTKKIAINYIFGGRFIIDFLSTVPLDDMVPGSSKIL